MQNNTHVCLDCRVTAKGRGEQTCPQCRSEMIDCGSRWRPPKKNNDKAWNSMQPAKYIDYEYIAGLSWLKFYPGRAEIMQWEGITHKKYCKCTECRPVKTKEKSRSLIPQWNKYGLHRSR